MTPTSIFVVSVLLSFVLPTSSLSISLPNDDLAIIRQRILELSVWPTKENISDTVEYALFYSQTLNSSCYWPDINYFGRGLVVWTTAYICIG
jgi:hypothetical protein